MSIFSFENIQNWIQNPKAESRSEDFWPWTDNITVTYANKQLESLFLKLELS